MKLGLSDFNFQGINIYITPNFRLMSWVHLNTDHFNAAFTITNKKCTESPWHHAMMISLIPPLYFKMFYSYTPQIWSSLRCSLIVGITGEKEPLFHQDIISDLKSYQDGLSQLIFTFQFHNQFNVSKLPVLTSQIFDLQFGSFTY